MDPSPLLIRWWRSPIYQGVCQAIWLAVILSLPITSLPLLRKLSGATTVAPPSAVLLVLLALVWLLPYLLQGGRIPVESVPLLLFGGMAVLAWALSFFLEAPSYREYTILTEAPQAFLTLAVGLISYLVPATQLSAQRNKLHWSIKLINWSGLLLIAWSMVQVIFIFYFNNRYPVELIRLQRLISTRRIPLYPDRVTGLAYEPSWLAHQLNMIYLPVWLSATLHRYSAHRIRLWRFSLENGLLIAGIFLLLVSQSRVGILSFMLVVAFLSVEGAKRLAQRVHAWRAKSSASAHRGYQKILLSTGMLILFLSVYLAAAIGLFFLGARADKRIARALQQDPRAAGGFLELTNQFAFAERVVYWDTGLKIFGDHPLFGVGLGNSGFYFPQKMPIFGWGLWEISLLFNYGSNLANTKSLWVRILAETGLAGFAIFLAWIYLLWHSNRLSRNADDLLVRVWGLSGQMVLISFITEGFSLDSFALPYFWVAMGLSSAAAALARRQVIS